MKRINFIANIKLLVLFYKRVGATSEEVYHTVGDMELKGAAIDVQWGKGEGGEGKEKHRGQIRFDQ